MKIIISPAKKMVIDQDILEKTRRPVFLENARELKAVLSQFSIEELKALYNTNDKITRENYDRLQSMDLDGEGTPALLAYSGIQYQSMAPQVFTEEQWNYVREHLYILSGFYGILRADDGVTPYRLEMQAKLMVNGKKDLYEYWDSLLYKQLAPDQEIIVNLASKEYSQAVEPYLKPGSLFITCMFGEEKDGKVKVKATAAKMARGAMVRYMAEHKIKDPAQLSGFSSLGYKYRKEYSSETKYVFTV